MKNNVDYLVECMVKDLTLFLIRDFDMDIREALRTLYTSETYIKLQDPRTGLYFQSPLYVYDFLKREIITGKLS